MESTKINNEITDLDDSDLPDGFTCEGYGVCIDCCKGTMIRASKSCEKKTCWTGCTQIATILVIKSKVHKWKVCTHCANRGLCALDNLLDCLGKRYDLATNQELFYPYPYTSKKTRKLFYKLKACRRERDQKLCEMKIKARKEKERRSTKEYIEAKRLGWKARDKERKESLLELQHRFSEEWNQ